MSAPASRFLGFLKHGSNVALLTTIAAIPVLAAAKRLPLAKRAIPAGIAIFIASEYGIHRYSLHAKPVPQPFVRGLQHRLHYDHHVEPSKLELLFIPLWAWIPTQGFFAGIYQLLGRNAAATAGLVLGNALATFYYEWVHYVAHIPYAPRTPWGRYMKKYHLWHHFKNENLWYGVTTPWADHLNGTYQRVDEAERSASVKVLYAP